MRLKRLFYKCFKIQVFNLILFSNTVAEILTQPIEKNREYDLSCKNAEIILQKLKS